jgi:crotonobetainyl-CoA:carnitine CoA-transferase CaiB-like acyl-CoA transferase
VTSTSETSVRSGPLSHVRVLDLSRVLAGPWAGQLLADLGADVIKVERTGTGDDTRGWGPPFLKAEDGTETSDAAYFLAVNRGKRSVTADLATEEGQQLVRDLASRSDILIENFKVGTLAKFGLSYDDLSTSHPRLIYCSITGFGQTGPKRDHAAYDFMMQAAGGLMSVTGGRDDQPGGGPQKVGVPIVDIMTGMYAAVAILAAMTRRDLTGRGDYIDIGMLDVAVASLANQAMNYLMTGTAPRRNGNAHPNIQPQDVFATGDGHLALAVGNDGQFVKLCEAIERPDLAQDDRFRTNAGRVRHTTTLTPLLKETLLQRGTSEWIDRFERAGVPAGPIRNIAQVFEDAQVVHRGMLVTLPHAAGGDITMVGSPMRFTASPLHVGPAPPTLGQHTQDILAECGHERSAPVPAGATPDHR